MASGLSIGTPEFHATSEVRKYCEDGRKLLRPLSNELLLASEELRAALREVPTGRGGAMAGRVDSRYQARIVAAHLKHSADGVNTAVAGLVRTWLSFERNFLNATPERSKKYFDLNK